MSEVTCFVIQKFDNSVFDSRYFEVIKPALENAELKPIRADEILGVRPIIENIEEQIEKASNA